MNEKIFGHLANALSAILGSDNPPAQRQRKPIARAAPALNFGSTPSCCIAKRAAVGPGKLPPVRKAGSK